MLRFSALPRRAARPSPLVLGVIFAMHPGVVGAQGKPGEMFEGKVARLYPNLDWTSRTRTAEAVEPRVIEQDLRGVENSPSPAMLVEATFRLSDHTELIVHTDRTPAKEELPKSCSCVAIQSVETQDGGFSMRIRTHDA